jgi:transposase
MNAYSEDLRKKIVEAKERGMPTTEVARTFGVGLSSVKRYAKTAREGGSLRPKSSPGRRPKADESARRLLEADLEERPAATLAQRCEYLRSAAGLRVSESTVSRLLRRLGWTRKKTASIAIMVLTTSRPAGLTRKKEGFVPFHRSVDRSGGRRGATGRSRT